MVLLLSETLRSPLHLIQDFLVQESHFLISRCIIQVCVSMACAVQGLSGIARLLVFFSWVLKQHKIKKCQSLVFLFRCVLEHRKIRKCQSLVFLFRCILEHRKIRKCQSLVLVFKCVLERRETRKCQSLVFVFECVLERSNIRSDSSGARPTPPECRTCLVWSKAV